jgi:hypothetical protein
LKLRYEEPHSHFVFQVNVCRYSSGKCDDAVPAAAITLKTAIAGKLTLAEFKKASFGFSVGG